MSQQEVKLKVLPTSHVGPVMPEPGAGPELTYPKGLIPYTMSCVRMAYHQGTLYADLPPATWASIDHDRAAALGYGKREAWPEFPQIISYASPKQGSGNRFDKYHELEAALFPAHRIWFTLTAFQANRSRGGRTMALSLEEFDRMTTQEIVKWVRARLP